MGRMAYAHEELGHVDLVWEKETDEDAVKAKERFYKVLREGGIAFRTDDPRTGDGTVIRHFEPEANEILLQAFPLKGG